MEQIKQITIEYKTPNSVYINAVDERGFTVVVHIDNSCGDVAITNWIKD